MTTIAEEPLTAESKADFTTIYNQPDPRAYYRTLGALDYCIPQTANPVIEATLRAARGNEPARVLDVCCSYGINAALLRCDTNLEEITARCIDQQGDAAPAGGAVLAPDAVVGEHTAFYAQRLAHPEVEVLGLDVAPAAIDYAVHTGLLAGGWAENLEDDEPSTELATALRGVDLITCTGGVGYIGAPTYERILNALERPDDVWAVTFALRVFDCEEIVEVFDRAGLVTEKIPDRTFAQRRFASIEEQSAAIADVRRRGLDPAGIEAEGWFHAECYLTRPAEAAERLPVADLLRPA